MSYSSFTFQGGSAVQGPQGAQGLTGPAGPAGLSSRNLLINGQPSVWQRYVGGSGTVTLTAAGNVYGPDRWQLKTAGTPVTASQVAGPLPNSFAVKIQRTAASTVTSQVDFGQSLTRARAIAAIGNYVVYSFQARAGANLSALPTFIIYGGSGSSDVSALSTGFTNQAILASLQPTLTTSWQNFYFAVSSVVASTNTQLAVDYQWLPQGVAGSDDSFTVGENQLEVGQTPTTYEWIDLITTLNQCYPYYEKSYLYNIAPKTANSTLAYFYLGYINAPVNLISSYLAYRVGKISTPSVAAYSVVSSTPNTFTYINSSGGLTDASTGGATPLSMSADGFLLQNNAGTAINVTQGLVHYVADAELY